MKRIWNNILGGLLMAPAEGEDGGSGAGSFITPSAGGGKDEGSGGNDNPPPGTSGGKAPTDTPNSGAAKGNEAPDWKSALPKELQEDANIKKFTDISTLAKSYVNAQKLIGADKIAVPTKYTTDDEWKGIYKKLGVPEKLEDYAVKFKEGVAIDDKFAGAFKELAHKTGIHPKQAQALADWFSDANAGAEQEFKAEMDKKFKADQAALKADWGNAFDLNIARANKVVNEIGGKELAAHLKNTGLGADKDVIKFLAKIGEAMYAEHKFVEGQGSSMSMTPDQIKAEIAKIHANPAYFDKAHPQQKVLVQEMAKLYEQLNPPKK